MRLQHRPAAECGQEEQEMSPADAKCANGDDGVDDGDNDDGEEEDEIVADQPPTISNKHITAAGDDSGEGRHPPKNKEQQCSSSSSSSNTNTKRRGKAMTGVASDAQLSCPLCFTTVCLECQRHAKYANQFRAVTGINVNVNHDEFLTLDQVSGGGAGGGRQGGRNNRGNRASAARDSGSSTGRGAQQEPPAEVGGGEGGSGEEEMFHPVCCRECDHGVGVYDAEEVFHFFGVIASG